MHDSDSGIWIDSGMIPFFAGTGIGIGIKNIKIRVESESELESDFWDNLESESESHMGRNRSSLVGDEQFPILIQYHWADSLSKPVLAFV